MLETHQGYNSTHSVPVDVPDCIVIAIFNFDGAVIPNLIDAAIVSFGHPQTLGFDFHWLIILVHALITNFAMFA